MPTSTSLFFLINTLVVLAHTRGRAKAQLSCESTSCDRGGISIQFPFSLRQEAKQSPGCGYPGFEMTCTNSSTGTWSSEPLLTFPGSGKFVVKLISLEDQAVWINDPDECLPNRIMHNRRFNLLEGSPFKLSTDYNLVNYSFLSCPSNLTAFSMVHPITCLNSNSSGGVNHNVVAMLSEPPYPTPWASPCRVMSWALIPVRDVQWLFWTDYNSDVKLEWESPECGSCVAGGGSCGFLEPRLGDTGFRVGCYDFPAQLQGLSRKAKYAIGISLGLPGLLGIIGLACFFGGKMKMREQQRHPSNETISSLMLPRLDMESIVRYPKTLIGESGRLPRPNDNTCSICLCEYQPKETLRTIPECNHYFHANCIDGWLKMNATCPLCRMPPRSFSFTWSLTTSLISRLY